MSFTSALMIIFVNFLVTEVVFCENYLDIEHLDKTYSDVDVFSYGEYEREDRLKRSAFYRCVIFWEGLSLVKIYF